LVLHERNERRYDKAYAFGLRETPTSFLVLVREANSGNLGLLEMNMPPLANYAYLVAQTFAAPSREDYNCAATIQYSCDRCFLLEPEAVQTKSFLEDLVREYRARRV
jgi:hypothetical protein